MSTRRLSWRRLGLLLASIGIGAIGLVMWSSSSASALDAPTPPAPAPTPTLSGTVGGLIDQVTAPLDQLLAPTGIELSPVLAPVSDGVLDPTLAAVDSTLAGIGGPIGPVGPLPTVPDLTGLPAAPVPDGLVPTVVPTRPEVGSVATGASGPTTAEGAALAGASTPSIGGTRVDDRATTTSLDVAHLSIEPASDAGGPASAPTSPTPAPLAQAALGSLASAGQTTAGLLLLAVLAGAAAALGRPTWRRLALFGLLTPRAPAYAIVTPPG